ncbi:potassium-transporting ATPase subunit KdpA, partial [Klebsiella pneumoniae]|uniref:potassium-transporting ATPase subunit KdpA n=1 Tax=Klebsiella pneumoniae TaxID=573 RepID=UPI0022B9DE48
AYWAEGAGNPIHQALGLVGGNMEGKEVRFGIAATALFAVVTTAASCGAVIGAHSSLMPIGGLVALFNMQLGEIVIGG